MQYEIKVDVDALVDEVWEDGAYWPSMSREFYRAMLIAHPEVVVGFVNELNRRHEAMRQLNEASNDISTLTLTPTSIFKKVDRRRT